MVLLTQTPLFWVQCGVSKFGREDNRLAGAVVTSLASLLELGWGISGESGLEGVLGKTGHLGP